ncbi:uncharacterized protein LOC141864635 isoform X2 [Acropora palmata]|uniref:uncharacterized protein LOC141864635 isoform X2 n=1 Tax=Acropora palmata TaxID=6131 RepID=UPI003DA1C35B
MKDEPVAEIADSVEEISQEKVVAISDMELESTMESVNESDLKENLENPCVKESEEDHEAKSDADDQAHSDEESEQTLKETESTVTIQGECDLMTRNREYSYMNYCKYSKE